ncbi:riboflavin synthase alpha chain [Bernardetia litoralis DSM 6794]|uniref:Riboflavin synthase n=1 Tax=Bernardetia litoralis (strain ATCC 23117 / DSM 6794 / NBRC 15988 / NCIMB 1366 / Fx l1 / Sio-4) TaxID=880071 RepID=I4AJ59_BERLS|nr:riboflavin synthase [Bernardetia litoralis]AFM03994.1 riboflavin synthase alpha chain [Bernardetia litoralis DSM 6794]
MFTGIIEEMGTLISIQKEGTNQIFEIESPISHELKIDQSIAHNGVCLTVTKVEENRHFVTAIEETLQKTDLSSWKEGSKLNLERCMPANGRFDGHIVQGHVDQTAICTNIIDENGSWRFYFEYEDKGNFTVQKGSICTNGVSLTIVDSESNQETQKGSFSVAIIPYTYENTNFHKLKVGDTINLEFDIVGKYMKLLFEKHFQSMKN